MKKTILFSLSIAFYSFSNAQGYTFNVSQNTYSDLILSTSLTNGATWDDPTFDIPIGFTFQIYNTPMTTLTINGAGYGALISSMDWSSSPTPLLFANGADIIDRGYDDNVGPSPTGGLSNISYLTTGSAGNKIFKLEWNDVGFYSELTDDNVSTDYTNFQLWLYESTGNIEIHFGPTSVTQPTLCYEGETGLFFGIYASYDLYNFNNLGSGLELTGPANTPTAQASIDPYLTFTNGTVSNGTVYRFVRTPLEIDEQIFTSNAFTLSPNPTHGNVQIFLNPQYNDNAEIIVTNQLGQIVEQYILPTETKQYNLDLSAFDNGIYFITIKSNGSNLTKQVIKN